MPYVFTDIFVDAFMATCNTTDARFQNTNSKLAESIKLFKVRVLSERYKVKHSVEQTPSLNERVLLRNARECVKYRVDTFRDA